MGYTVLFSGTACQTAGLSSFLGSSLKKNLILIDICMSWGAISLYLEGLYNLFRKKI